VTANSAITLLSLVAVTTFISQNQSVNSKTVTGDR